MNRCYVISFVSPLVKSFFLGARVQREDLKLFKKAARNPKRLLTFLVISGEAAKSETSVSPSRFFPVINLRVARKWGPEHVAEFLEVF